MNKTLKLKKGDELTTSLISFCQKNNITSGWFLGIGAASNATLAIYNLEKKEYFRKELSGILEILNLSGNIATLDNKTVLHCHATLADENFQAHGGHIEKLIVAATCEIGIFESDTELKRIHDDEIGLNLLDL